MNHTFDVVDINESHSESILKLCLYDEIDYSSDVTMVGDVYPSIILTLSDRYFIDKLRTIPLSEILGTVKEIKFDLLEPNLDCQIQCYGIRKNDWGSLVAVGFDIDFYIDNRDQYQSLFNASRRAHLEFSLRSYQKDNPTFFIVPNQDVNKVVVRDSVSLSSKTNPWNRINEIIFHLNDAWLTLQAIYPPYDEEPIDEFTASFNFPPEIKTACNQYLIYFAQFLSDIGIEAQTEIKEDLHSTLFRIKPEDKNEGLDRIRTALDVFLAAPTMSTASTEQTYTLNVAAQQFQFQIRSLESQIDLMRGTLQAKDAALFFKDATIEALNLSKFELQRKIDSKPPTLSADEIPIFGGIITLRSYETKGLKIDIPALYRKLERRFKR